MMLLALEWDWTSPAWLALLALPIALVVLWRRESARRELSGAAELWEPGRGAASSPRRRRAPPPRGWLALGALAAATLALADPRIGSAREPRRWTLVVDRSPSMHLPVAPGSEESRLARAESLALDWLAARRAQGDVVEWIAFDPRGREQRVEQVDLPDAWRRAPSPPAGEVAWSRFDRPGAIWLTDRAPSIEPRDAAWFASGGDAIAGPIALERDRELVWDGSSVASVEAPAANVALEGALPPTLAELARLWAATRGLRASSGERERVVLTIAALAGGVDAAVSIARDGWSARGRAWIDVACSGEPTQVAAIEGFERSLACSTPGRVEIAWREIDAVEGDAAAFAVAFAELFDGARIDPPEVIALAERAAAGPPSMRAPEGLEAASSASEEHVELAWPLALVAAALALAAAIVKR